MTDVVPEVEEFGHDVPMDPTMEREDSEHSEELDVSEAPDSEDHMDHVEENEEAADRFDQSTASRGSTTPTPTADESAVNTSGPISTFDWDTYLREQNAEPAPRECFFQPDTPPENKFQIGMKLMIADPRGPTGSSAMFCLGTVVSVYKVWLCIRIEGLDNSHEKWIFCDDDTIQPIRPDSEDHMKLNPPIGFIHHHGIFRKFLEQHLKPDDETGASVLCPPEWFKPISETLRPARNLFKVGQRVEAIDQRSFNGKTCPATIADVTKNQIQIHFDGWNNGYDIKEPFYTRSVMPVGWSKKNDVEISPPKAGGKSARSSSSTTSAAPKQPPADHKDQKPDTKPSSRSRSSAAKAQRSSLSGHHPSVSSSSSSASSSSSRPGFQRLSDMGVNPLQSVRRSRGQKRPPSSKSGTATPPPTKRGSSKESTVQLSPENDDRIRSAIERTTENTVEDKVKGLLMNAKVEQQKLAKQLSQPAMTYLSSTKLALGQHPLFPQRAQTDMHYVSIKNEAEEVVSSTTASVGSPQPSGLRPSPLASRDLAKVVGQIRPKIQGEDRGSSPASSSTHTQPVVCSGTGTQNPQRSHDVLLLPKDEIPLKERLMTVFVNYSCQLGPHLDPAMVAGIRRKFGPYATHHALREAVQQLLNCAKDDSIVINLVHPAAVTQILSVTAHCGGMPRSRFIPCVKSAVDAWNYLKQLLRKMKVCENFYSSTGDPCPLCEPCSDASIEQVVAFSMPMKQWSIDKVAFELRKVLDDTMVTKFVEQQIDGRSLGLLTRELLMNYMGLALGPALKVIDFIESVRKAQDQQRTTTTEGAHAL